jgi:hypothetical protein
VRKQIAKVFRGWFGLRSILVLFRCLFHRDKLVFLLSSADFSVSLQGKFISPFAHAIINKLKLDSSNSVILFRNEVNLENCNGLFSVSYFVTLCNFLKIGEVLAWKVIFTILNPKAVFVIDWDPNLNAAANQKKIKAVYIQHGLIVDDHRLFGKTALQNTTVVQRPSAFLSWNSISANNFAGICKAFVIGNPWNYYFLENSKNHLYSAHKNAEILNQAKKKIILLTLSWGDHLLRAIPNEIIPIIKQTFNDYTWIIRPHPVVYKQKDLMAKFTAELKHTFTTEELNGIYYLEFSSFPLPLILSKCNAHITIDSSVVIEAAEFGVPSLVLNHLLFVYGPNGENTAPYGGPSYFKKERELGYATVYNDGLNIAQWISNVTKEKMPSSLNSDLVAGEWQSFKQFLQLA